MTYREYNDRPIGEGWTRWALRWIFRGAVGMVWASLLVGAAFGLVFGIIYWIASSPSTSRSCAESARILGAWSATEIHCDADQRVRLQIDPTDKSRTLALCECVNPQAPSASGSAER